ncbi:MAG: hypothetical protein QOE46_1333 [Acidobacteriota bacterium]|jgi:Zn-dependent M28 family amino/carboxypeptidase|nr:hypothetical protein [Acidobacteriota bacterium]
MLYKKTLPLLIALALLIAPAAARAQTAAQPFVPDVERLRAHITYLASDKLEGRRTGTPGAEEAARYVAAEFMRLGLLPGANVNSNELTEKAYMQEFPYVAGVALGKRNELKLTGRGGDEQTGGVFQIGEDWMPLGFSANGRVDGKPVFVGYGITAAEQSYDDYKNAGVAGNVAVALAGTPDGDNPHGRFSRAGEIRFKAAAAHAAGAAALVLVAAGENLKDDKLSALKYDNAGGDSGLPVIVISRQVASKVLGLDSTARLIEVEKSVRELSGATHAGTTEGNWLARLKLKTREGHALRIMTDVVRKNAPSANVVGILEGSDAKLKTEVIVIGAHYDHLGHGGDGSLAAREGEIHHGADDNASGTAGLLELARLFSQERAEMKRTVVFVAFSGEEEGLIGSSFYVQHPVRPLAQTVAMINMDMIGRLREGTLNVGGIGTAAEWRAFVEEANRGYKVTLGPTVTATDATRTEAGAQTATASVVTPIIVTGSDGRTAVTATPAARFTLRLSEDGFGPSDHSSFYARRVPVLFFFTGSHEDYHKPSDTADRINYEGEALVLQFVRDLVQGLQASDRRPTYAVAKAEANSRTTFRVSLGTVPSYADSTDGLKLDAVREGSPAAVAGLKAGDKIVKLAGHDVRNVYDYTQILSELKAGQEYEVEVVRDGQRLNMKVTPAVRK